ncbi:3-oxoacyl-[acyl-carrier-protein] synthase-3 [Chitinophaga jiangningensis]|uniref:3-oxoacyl-[acyl-carrier-protein] synthase-3 n=1 Tax=Chitinophaga jiangningensis TaxID=1419482 RepID=A0A1M7HIM6_9BACT|nr:ketoacyl-ACP synthase III [Chitinophaga jiangningensis]SHM28346.1 3-oxoacyl-[acyl-carrier-protein] synthase-3 [Chitinophaga jiangningensis]
MNAYIKAISYYLPEQVLTNEMLVTQFPEWSVEKVASKIGIQERRIAAPDEFVSDMAVKAGEALLQEYNIPASDIDFVLLCTQSPDFCLPTTACLVQNKLGIPTNAGAIDFNLGCSGFVYGLAFAKGLIAGGIAKNILLITSETYSKYLHPLDKGNRTIFGDAAAATLISTSGFAEIGQFELGTDGRGAENLIVRNGGSRAPRSAIPAEATFDGNDPISPDCLYMNGSEIFNFTLESVPQLVKTTLSKNTLTDADIDLYVFHQANQYMLNFLRRKIGISEEKFFLYMSKVGNTVSSTIPIALKAAMEDGKIKSDRDRVLLAGFGVGYSWGGCVLNFA